MTTLNVELNFNDKIYYVMGTKNKPVVIQGYIKYMYISTNLQLVYVVMDAHVVKSYNKNYKAGEYVKSLEFKNDDINKIAFTDKKKAQAKLKEMRNE